MSDSKDDFKFCPYCGSEEYGDEGLRLRLTSISNGYFAVACFCGAAGPIRNSEESAIEAWNSRDYSNRRLAQHAFSILPATTSPCLKGNLKSFDFSVVLQIMSSANKTGVLYLKQRQDVRTLFLREGKIIAASGKEGLRLGEIGYCMGLISQIQLQDALVQVKKTGKRMGEVLLDLEYLTEEELKELIRYQIQETVSEVSLWEEGDFEFRNSPVEFDERGIEDINTFRMLLEASVRKDEQVAA